MSFQSLFHLKHILANSEKALYLHIITSAALAYCSSSRLLCYLVNARLMLIYSASGHMYCPEQGPGCTMWGSDTYIRCITSAVQRVFFTCCTHSIFVGCGCVPAMLSKEI